jgi:hypothetical protein
MQYLTRILAIASALPLFASSQVGVSPNYTPINAMGYVVSYATLSNVFSQTNAGFALLYTTNSGGSMGYVITAGSYTSGIYVTVPGSQAYYQDASGVCPKDCDMSYSQSGKNFPQSVSSPQSYNLNQTSNLQTLQGYVNTVFNNSAGNNIIVFSKSSFQNIPSNTGYVRIMYTYDIANALLQAAFIPLNSDNTLNYGATQYSTAMVRGPLNP